MLGRLPACVRFGTMPITTSDERRDTREVLALALRQSHLMRFAGLCQIAVSEIL
jgi:hypothetical protein